MFIGKSFKNTFVFASVFLFAGVCFQAQAGIVARVLEAKGNSFAFNSEGKAQQLKFGSKIEDMSEVMVDDNSSLSVLDSAGNEHHLAGGSYAKFFNSLVELKNGNMWTIVLGNRASLVNSMNAFIKASSGQFITVVDNASLKTQVLALTGKAQLASSIEPGLSVPVPAGHFSFIDQSYKEGLPRAATRVGLQSYQKMKMAFSSIKSLEKRNGGQMLERSFQSAPHRAKRSIASIGTNRGSSVRGKKGKLIYLKDSSRSRSIASVKKGAKVSALDYYKKLSKNKAKNKKASVAKVRYFGLDFDQKTKPVSTPAVSLSGAKKKSIALKSERREPASVSPGNIVSDINSAFENSLKSKLEGNKRHPDEVNQLIDELKSFKKDYSKHY